MFEREVQADAGVGHPTHDRILRQVIPSSDFLPRLISLRRCRPVSLEKPLGQEHQPALSTARDQKGLVGRIHPFHRRAEMIPDPRGARKGPPMGDPGFETVGMEALGTDPCPQTGPRMRSAQAVLEVNSPHQDHAPALPPGNLECNALGLDSVEQSHPDGPRPGGADSRKYDDPRLSSVHASAVAPHHWDPQIDLHP